jgi:outer membrane protein
MDHGRFPFRARLVTALGLSLGGRIMPTIRLCCLAGVVALIVPVPRAFAQAPLTLAEALAEAHAHNATLPIAAFDTAMAAAQLRAASGRLWPALGIDGDVHGGTPSKYASGDARLQLVAGVPIYDGGRLRAGVRQAQAQRAVTAATYRVATRDLDLAVTSWFSQVIELQEEISLGERGLERLGRYIDLINARRESGQPVVGDLLKARVQRDGQAADLAETQRQLAGAMLQLKELLGRSPEDTLELAPLPTPGAPGLPGETPWEQAPDVAAADAMRQSARTGVDLVRADRRPHLDLAANVGTEPVLGSSFEAPLNTGRSSGGELTLSLSWPLWDRGVHRGELATARFALDQATQAAAVARRDARLQWNQARADLTHLYDVVQLRDSTVPVAEDAYLQAESLYRGGGADALEVLDAYAQWIQAGLGAARARLDYRVAEARAERWGNP